MSNNSDELGNSIHDFYIIYNIYLYIYVLILFFRLKIIRESIEIPPVSFRVNFTHALNILARKLVLNIVFYTLLSRITSFQIICIYI